MASRLTKTEKWDKRWFRKLPPEYKLVLMYLFDACDNAGIWDVDLDKIEFFTGVEMEKEKFLKMLPENYIVEIQNGEKWFFPKFLQTQYKTLNTKSKPIQAVLEKLEKNNLTSYVSDLFGKGYLTLSKGLPNPLLRVQDKDKEKDKDKEEEKEGGVGEEKTSRAEILTEEEARERMMTSEIWIQQVSMTLTTDPETVINYIDKFFMLQKVKENLDRPMIELKRHFVEWLKIQLQKEKNNGNQSLTEQARKIVFGS